MGEERVELLIVDELERVDSVLCVLCVLENVELDIVLTLVALRSDNDE